MSFDLESKFAYKTFFLSLLCCEIRRKLVYEFWFGKQNKKTILLLSYWISIVYTYSGFNRCHCTIVCRGFEIISCQCFVSDAPDPFLPWIIINLVTFEMRRLNYLPANKIRPINSLRPILSKSITITSSEHSRIFSHGTLKLKASLNTGFNVHLKMGVFRFSIRLSPNWSQTLT